MIVANEVLVREIQKGNRHLEHELYKNVEGLIIQITSQFYQKNKSLIKKIICLDYDDVLQIARCGFMKSIKSFDTEQGILFSTYLVNTIQLTLHTEFYRNKDINVAYRKDTAKIELKDNIPLTHYDDVDNRLIIEEAMSVLDEREKNIITDKFLVGLKPEEMRNKYGMSSPGIRNIEQKALAKMKEKIGSDVI